MTRLCAGLLVSAAAACSGHGADQGPSTGLDPDASTASVDAARGEGTAIVFDNADGTFEWTPTRYAPCCGTEPGVPLDLTLDADSQTGAPSPSAIEYYISWPEANITQGAFLFRKADLDTPDGLRIAQGEPVVLEGGDVETYTIHPPLAMSAGDTIGPELTWASSGQTVHLADPGGAYPPDYAAFTAGTIALEFQLDDGVHYGFVDVAWRDADYLSDGRHLAVRWGYETRPDTPLVIPP
jgi:hypothetical protein